MIWMIITTCTKLSNHLARYFTSLVYYLVRSHTQCESRTSLFKRYVLNYIIRDEIDKTTVLYLAKPKNETISIQQSEIGQTKWCDFDEALNTLTYDNWKEMFKQAIEEFLIA